jgi:hypothetical protein
VPELLITIGMVIALLRLPIGLKTIIHGAKYLRNLLVADPASLTGDHRKLCESTI